MLCSDVYTYTHFHRPDPPASTHSHQQEIASYAFKVDDAINGGDKAQKAFKPGYDVTTDPFYQARIYFGVYTLTIDPPILSPRE